MALEKQLVVRVNTELYFQIKTVASKNNISDAELVRNAITYYFENIKNTTALQT